MKIEPNKQQMPGVTPPPENKEKKDEMKQEENYQVATQWQLIWWKFKKHKAAMIAGPLLLLLIFIAILSPFISPTTPGERWSDYRYAPPQKIHFYDSDGGFSFRPFVYDMEQVTDPQTFRRTFEPDTSERHYIQFFTRGETYSFYGLFETNIHLFGLEDSSVPLFLMGSDQLGRDVFTRALYASRVSLSFGFVGIIFTLIIGLVLGGISGYIGGRIDTAIQRLIDLILCIPTIPLWMALAASLPRDWSSIQMYLGMVLIFSAIGWTELARVIRGKVLSLREEDFIMAARLSGATNSRIIGKHLLPGFASYIIVSVTITIPTVILGETALSFLGLGLQPPVVSWGVLLQSAQSFESLAHHPWLLWPAAFVVYAVLMFNFLGDGIRDAADPYK
ncbi:ABC transporter permease [Evansella sp. AB-P1]|uniref:ABC transporter permease n=1 Tax=Evansella sp. AB-P1 TaxID=3037653 RepID=UPI00241D2A52|nr:ABC transporter permease [Evansella sp. AB-P1]MDG5787212.1 ABC transporter permease [Evansella sp. AB-P1]